MPKWKQTNSILVVDDDPGILTAAQMALRPLGTHVEVLTDPHQMFAAIDSRLVDAILLDMNFAAGASSGAEGLKLLDRIVHHAPDISVVLMTAYGGVTLAVEALKRGACDFVLKPWQNEKLIATLTAAVALTRAKRDAASEGLRRDTLVLETGVQHGAIPFRSASHRQVMSIIEKAAPTDASILLLGESGTGKEVTAREIHRLSRRSHKPFMSVDLGAISENLFESELFGYRKGAFTGATSDRVGLIEAAEGGTLFLDEIGNLPLHLQSKLLTVIERREVMPLGATRSVSVDIRLISATNLTSEEIEQPTRFRQDLLYRIKTVEILLPPLRERKEDIQPLLKYFLDFYARKHRFPRRALSDDVLTALERYNWPGNIRELRHAAESVTILAAGEALTLNDFSFAKSSARNNSSDSTFDLEQLEREAIRRALDHFSGNISQAAIALGLTRPALYRRIARHGL